MICERCKKNEATVFYKETINGKTKSYSLCAECAAEAEKAGDIETPHMDAFFSSPSIGGIDSLFGSLFSVPHYAKRALSEGNAETKKCSLCGSAFGDLVKRGKVGCPKCYEVFADELDATIREIHGTTTHTGSAPKRFKHDRELKQKIKNLEAELKEAIKDENYERAAEIRDEVKALKEKEEN